MYSFACIIPKLKLMNFYGLVLGLVSFLIIGLCHPLVAKMEYYWSKKSWWILFILGFIFLIISFLVKEKLSIIFGIISFAFFWSTIEIFKQHERVMKGQAKANPKRKY